MKHLTLALFLFSAPSQAYLIPVFDPIGIDVAEAIGTNNFDIVETNGCIIKYVKYTPVGKSKIYGEIKQVDLRKALDRPSFCEPEKWVEE